MLNKVAVFIEMLHNNLVHAIKNLSPQEYLLLSVFIRVRMKVKVKSNTKLDVCKALEVLK